MPVIGIPLQALRERIGGEVGRGLGRPQLLELLGQIGCDVEGFAELRRVKCRGCGYLIELAGKEDVPPSCDRCQRDLRSSAAATEPLPPLEVVRMELLAVRPDIFDPGGLARALRGLLGVEKGLVEYELGPVAARVRVDDSVRRARSLRPHLAAAILENLTLDDDRVKIVMKLQENLHWALGRDRKHASIGVYDLDSLGAPASGKGVLDLEYTTEPPDYEFVPLGSTDLGPTGRRSLARILEEHPKGRAYAHLLAGFDRYPILRTQSGRVLSMPPVINSEETKVHLGTKRVFIDVTGSGRRIVERTLNILVTSLLEMDPSFRARRVEIGNATPDERETGASASLTRTTPDLSPQRASVGVARAAARIGLPFDDASLRDLLEIMRHRVTGAGAGVLQVEVPAYRNDIFHEVDLMEDAAIAYGYDRIPRSLVPTLTVGRASEAEEQADALREVAIGLGFLEIVTLPLTSAEESEALLGLPAGAESVVIENPISNEQTHLRTSLLPALLGTFARNRHHALPQRLFELGDVSSLDATAPTGARERRRLALGEVSPKAGFADIRAFTEALARELAIPFRLAADRQPYLVEGRAAALLGAKGETIGRFGEVAPEVLDRLGLLNPAVVLELYLAPRA